MDHIKIIIEKSSIPLIWIDTSIIIKMAKLKLKEKISEEEKGRIRYLYDIIGNEVNKKKLLCPGADQQEEIEIGGRLENECREIQTQLSLGIKMQHRQGIEDFLIAKFMKAYIDKVREINLCYKNLFHGDPIKELEEALSRPFIISVHLPTAPGVLNRSKKSKIDLPVELEKLRKEKIAAGITFEQEREVEFKGLLEASLELKRRLIEKLINNEPIDVWDFLGAEVMLNYERLWEIYKGQPPGLQGLVQFFLSDYFKQIPQVEIICSLYAKILTSTTPIKPGDSMDIKQIATILPVFDLVITDKSMENHIKSLNYHKKYNTTVLALRDFKEIKSFFEKL